MSRELLMSRNNGHRAAQRLSVTLNSQIDYYCQARSDCTCVHSVIIIIIIISFLFIIIIIIFTVHVYCTHRHPVGQEPVQVGLGDDEAVLALGLSRHLLLPQPLQPIRAQYYHDQPITIHLRLLASHGAAASTSGRGGGASGSA